MNKGYIDLHTHSLFSDGALLPSELIYRAKVKGYSHIAVSDHGDFSTLDFVIPRIKRIAAELSRAYGLTVLPGIEITYVPPALIKKAVVLSRKLGARIVVVHGETVAETVPPGTNLAAVMSGADVLAHPGMITVEEAKLAARNGVLLEITTRNGHNRTNRHVALTAKKAGALMCLDTDSHAPENLMNETLIKKTLKMSGLVPADFRTMQKNALDLIERRK